MLTATQILDRLGTIEFHDLPVEGLEFKRTETFSFILNISVYDQVRKDYKKAQLSFIGITDIETSPIYFSSNTELEIYSFEYDYQDEFACKLILLTGFGEPSLSIDLKCKWIELFINS